MIIAIGEILYDVFPETKRLGGAPFNFAAHLRAAGFPVVFVSRVGNDPGGQSIRDVVARRGFDPDYLQTDPDHPTGHVNVTLDDQGVPTFDIVRDVAYDHLEFTDPLAQAVKSGPRLIYYGTLIQRTRRGFETLRRLLEARPEGTRCFYDINLRPDCYSAEVIAESLRHCDVLKISDEELDEILPFFDLQTAEDADAAVGALRDRFDIPWVCRTRGAAGSVLYTPEGRYAESVGESVNVVDTVRAGDAYAAALAAGFLQGWPPKQIIRRATRFAARLCGISGAIPEDDSVYGEFRTWTREDGHE
jgi:fructokinase